MPFEAGGFDWDDGNRQKCRKHGSTLPEIEFAFQGTFAVLPDRTDQAEPRFNLIARNSEGRHLRCLHPENIRWAYADPTHLRSVHKSKGSRRL